MAKAKSKAKFLVADGAGGMVPVQDRRFEQGNWPISFRKCQVESRFLVFLSLCRVPQAWMEHRGDGETQAHGEQR